VQAKPYTFPSFPKIHFYLLVFNNNRSFFLIWADGRKPNVSASSQWAQLVIREYSVGLIRKTYVTHEILE
jgi:hypothetical protein